MAAQLIGGLGSSELLIIFGIIVLLFGATKLPDLARGTGRALRVFKDETKGISSDESYPDEGARPAKVDG